MLSNLLSLSLSWYNFGPADSSPVNREHHQPATQAKSNNTSHPPALRGLVFGFTVFLMAGFAHLGVANAAGGPYVVDDYEVPAPGECQIESWASFGGSGDRIFVAAPGCTFDAMPWIEVGFSVERLRSNGEWASAIAPALKASVIPIDRFGVGIGFATTVSYDWTARAVAGGTATALVTVERTERVRLNLNIGYERGQIDRRNDAVWGIGASIQPVDNLGFIAELFGRDRGHVGL
jgi:hypothetical protein